MALERTVIQAENVIGQRGLLPTVDLPPVIKDVNPWVGWRCENETDRVNLSRTKSVRELLGIGLKDAEAASQTVRPSMLSASR
jgi:hypothetical protein